MNKLLITFIAVAFAACNNPAPTTDSKGSPHVSPEIVNNPATASGNKSDASLPEFTFSESRFDFGTIKSGESRSHAFVFKNTGNADLIITQANGSCGCTVADYPKEPVPPGGEGKIEVSFNSEGQSGQIAKTITLLANTVPATKVLTISAEVLKD